MTFKNFSRLLFLLVITAVVVSSQDYPNPPPPPPPAEDQTIGSLGVQVITQFLTGDFVKRKLQLLFDIIDLKARLIYVITQFCTSENLLAFRRFLDWICRFAAFINQFLPSVPDENPKVALLGLILNMFNNFASPQTEAPAPYVPPLVDNTANPLVYSPPPYYNPNQQATDENNNNLQESTPELSSNVKRSLEPSPEAESKSEDPKLSDLSEDEIKGMLKNHEGVSRLSKLIYASRK